MTPGALAQFGPTTLDADVNATSALKRSSATARLAGGGAVVVWLSGATVMAQVVDAAGNPGGTAVTVGTLPVISGQVATAFSVAGTADGGFVVAWASPTYVLQFQRYDATGAVVGAGVVVDAASYSEIENVEVRAVANGSFVIAWEGKDVGSTTARAYLRSYDPSAAPTSARVAVSATAGTQADVQVVPQAGGGFLAAWIQADGSVWTIRTRRFDAALNPLAAETVVQSVPFVTPTELSMTTLANGTTLLAWGQSGSTGPEVRWLVLDAAGGSAVPLDSAPSTSFAGNLLIDTVQAVRSAGGFVVVVESTFWFSRGGTGNMTELDIDASGALKARTELGSRMLSTVSPTTGAYCGPAAGGVSAAGGEDGRYIIAYEQCGTTASGLHTPAILQVQAR